jgi:hypothetical protein
VRCGNGLQLSVTRQTTVQGIADDAVSSDVDFSELLACSGNEFHFLAIDVCFQSEDGPVQCVLRSSEVDLDRFQTDCSSSVCRIEGGPQVGR